MNVSSFFQKHQVNVYKARGRHLDDQKFTLTKKIKEIQEKILYIVFLNLKKKVIFCLFNHEVFLYRGT